MKPIQKLIGGVWELYLALGYDEIPSLVVEQHRSRGGGGGGHRLLSTSFFPCNAHRDNVKISLSKVARCPGAPPPVPPPMDT